MRLIQIGGGEDDTEWYLEPCVQPAVKIHL